MQIIIVPQDKLVNVDGKGLIFDFQIDPEIHAIQWTGKSGFIEYNDGRKNKRIGSIDQFMPIVDQHAENLAIENEKIRSENEERERSAADYAAFQETHTYKRKKEYPSVRDQFDMLFHGMDRGDIGKVPEFYDAIKAVKDKYPKT